MTRRQVKVVIRRDPDERTAWLANVAGDRAARRVRRSKAVLRRAWDSNPRWRFRAIAVFKTAAIGH